MSYMYHSEPESIHNGNDGYNENYCVSMYMFMSNMLTYETFLYRTLKYLIILTYSLRVIFCAITSLILEMLKY